MNCCAGFRIADADHEIPAHLSVQPAEELSDRFSHALPCRKGIDPAMIEVKRKAEAARAGPLRS